MNRRDVVENNLVERYLRGELDAEETAQFERFYLDDPETMDEMESSLIMSDYAELLKLPDRHRQSERSSSFWSWFVPVTTAFAGALIAVVFTAQFFGNNPSPAGNQDALRPAIVYDMVQRRSDASESLTVSNGSGPAVLRFFVPPGVDGQFDLQLTSGQSTQTLKDLSPDASGTIAVWLNQDDMRGAWELTLTGPQGFQAEYALDFQ